MAKCFSATIWLLVCVVPCVFGWGFGPSKLYSCPSTAKVCSMKEVTLESPEAIEQARFQDIHDPLFIDSGRIPNFSAELLKKLPTISDLTLGELSIAKLYVRANFRQLSAVNNEIAELLLDDSSDATFSMRILQLSHNKLTALPSLDRFVELRTLELDHNLLTTLDMAAFAKLAKLGELSLAHNRLLTVTSLSSVPVRLDHLKRLSFAGNQLVILDVRTWEMESLAELNVSRNSLNRFEGNLAQFQSLTKLELAGNRLYCDWFVVEPLLVNPPHTLSVDADKPDRCEAEKLMRQKDLCCNPVSNEGFGLLDVFDVKWDQLRRLTEQIAMLNASIASGSASVKPQLEQQHLALSTRLDAFVRKQEGQSEELQSLEKRVNQQKDDLSELETGLFEKVNELRADLNSKWNGTDETPLDGKSSYTSSVSTNWTLVAAQHENTLTSLRERLETTTKQFNVYTTKSYEQRASLKAQLERIDGLERKFERSLEQCWELQKRMDKVGPTIEKVYGFLNELRERSTEDI